MSRFEKGESYWATPCLKGQARRVVTVVGRGADCAIFAQPSPAATRVEMMSEIDGREFAQIVCDDGRYTVSSASRCDLAGALEVMAVVRPQGFRRAARRFFCGGVGNG